MLYTQYFMRSRCSYRTWDFNDNCWVSFLGNLITYSMNWHTELEYRDSDSYDPKMLRISLTSILTLMYPLVCLLAPPGRGRPSPCMSRPCVSDGPSRRKSNRASSAARPPPTKDCRSSVGMTLTPCLSYEGCVTFFWFWIRLEYPVPAVVQESILSD